MSNWDEYFGTRRWRVATEVTGTVERVAFTKGRFEISGGVFHSPLSSARGRKGILLQEIDPESGKDIEDSQIAVGVVVFRRARKERAVRQSTGARLR